MVVGSAMVEPPAPRGGAPSVVPLAGDLAIAKELAIRRAVGLLDGPAGVVRMEARVQGADGRKADALPLSGSTRSGVQGRSDDFEPSGSALGKDSAPTASGLPDHGSDSPTGIATTRRDGTLALATLEVPVSATFTPHELTERLRIASPFSDNGTMSMRGSSPILLDGHAVEQGIAIPVNGGGLLESASEVRIEFRPGSALPLPGNNG